MDVVFALGRGCLESSPPQTCRQSSALGAGTTCSREVARVGTLIPGSGSSGRSGSSGMSVGAQGRSGGLLGYSWEFVWRCSACVCVCIRTNVSVRIHINAHLSVGVYT